MKNLRNFCVTTALILVFTAPALAGQMDTGRTSPPPTTTSGEMGTGTITPTTSATTTGQMDTGAASTEEDTAAGSLTGTVLSLLQSILGLI